MAEPTLTLKKSQSDKESPNHLPYKIYPVRTKLFSRKMYNGHGTRLQIKGQTDGNALLYINMYKDARTNCKKIYIIGITQMRNWICPLQFWIPEVLSCCSTRSIPSNLERASPFLSVSLRHKAESSKRLLRY